MPGHKGRGMGEFSAAAAWDVTELSFSDDLYAPEGAIALTEAAYARVYQARQAFLSVNGSSACVCAMLLALGEHRRVLLARDCHRSAVNGVALAGHEAAFVYPRPDGLVAAADISAALDARPADAVMIVSPDYYGRCAHVSAIAEVCHSRGALLLVDCAHGAHFPFSKELPDLPAEYADMWCVSCHKTLAAFTQSAVLFSGVCCPLSDMQIRNALRMMQSSSPSYLLMAGLDWALHSVSGWDGHIKRITAFKSAAASINGISVYAQEGDGVFCADPARVVLDVSGRGISGRAAYDVLEAHGVVAEMADERRVVFITSPEDPDEWYDRALYALTALPYGTHIPPASLPLPPQGEACMSIRAAVFSTWKPVPLPDCTGRICAAPCGAYPPGTAALMPGERITQAAAAYLAAKADSGIPLFGMVDGSIPCTDGKNDI